MKKLLFLLVFAALNVSAQYKIIVLGDGYRPSDQALFLSDVNLLKNDLLLCPPFRQRPNSVTFYPYTFRNRFNCRDGSFWEGISCDDTKIAAEARSANVPFDLILLLLKSKGGGGGGAVCTVGMYYHDVPHSASIFRHELGHSAFGFNHNTGGLMDASCNQGACGWNVTYTPSQTYSISSFLNRYSLNTDFTPPTLDMTADVFNSNSVYVEAFASDDAMIIEIYLDGQLKSEQVYWGTPDRIYYCNPITGVKFWFSNLQSGTHQIKIKATDSNINYSIATSDIVIN